MKIFKIIPLILLLLSANISFSQKDNDKIQFREEIEKILKTKLVDSLGLDEISADKFLNLYKENNKEIKSLSKEKREILNSIELDPSASDVDSKFNKMLELETEILEKRKSLFIDLHTFLTPQQIAKSLILRKNMRKELRKEFKKHRKGSKNKQNK